MSGLGVVPAGLPRVGEIGSLAGTPDLPPIISSDPASFAWHVWHDRHPALFAHIRGSIPYPAGTLSALEALLSETLTGPMLPLPDDAPDKAAWDDWGREHFDRPWLDAPFLWAESYFYRRLLHAVGFFAPGPWFGIDPFEFLKTAELDTAKLDDDLRQLDELAELPPREKTHVLMHAAVWGNQADLGFRIGVAAAAGRLGPSAHLVADDTAAVISRLADGGAAGDGTVLIVADNAGRELVSDLVFADHLLCTGFAGRVVLQLKPQPYYVSDAVTADFVACLRRLARSESAATDIAGRLWTAVADGRLVISTHWFYCTPFTFHRTPPDLVEQFAAASLVILKGDLNYRRLVGDYRWPEGAPFGSAVAYLPAPVVALRTLKSDVVVGVDPGTVAALDADVPTWRTNGQYALVQARL